MTRLAFAVLVAGLAFAAAPACAQDQPTPLPPSAVPDAPIPVPVPVPETLKPPQRVPDTPPLPPGPDDGRYTFHRVPDGFVRLDSRTGQVSTCGNAGGGWSCQAAADERAALESEIARLQGDNSSLKKELLARGLGLPDGVKADPPVAKAPEAMPDPSAKTPSDAQIDNAMAVIERVWRRMVDMMANMQREMQRKN